MTKTVAQYIIQRLETEVDHAFCFVGGAAIFLFDALNSSKIKPIFNLHEQACSIAADAYGQYSNKLGLCIVTAGPGSLNALTGVAAAFIDSTPMIILSGQANTNQLSEGTKLRSKGIQEVKTEDIVKNIVKKVYTIRNHTATPQIIEDAIYHAKHGRPGPVWIDIPLDIQNKILEVEAPRYYSFPTPKIFYKIFDKTITDPHPYNFEWVDKLKQAKKPVILIGNGVRLSHAEGKLNTLIELLNIPIMTTWRAMDLYDENHYLYVGRPGMIGQRGANEVLQTCDFLLCLGARLDLASVAFNYKNFAPNAYKVIVDIDEAEIDKLDFEKIKIVDNVESFIAEFLHTNKLPLQDINKTHEWLIHCKKLHQQPIETIKSNKLSLYQFLDKLSPLLENKVVIVGSSGSISECFCQAIKLPKGCRVIQSNGLGSMGFGLPAAIGAHYASGKPVIMLDGDGSFALNIQELGLIAEQKLPITMMIINNGGYVSIKNTQNNLCGGRQLGVDLQHGLALPDYEELAKTFDIPYYNSCWYENQTEFLKRLHYYTLDRPGPHILEIFTDPNHQTQCRTKTERLPDGTLKASGLERLWPFQ
jgi:acetolactate synthase-1/2/3 large subunit